jgi:hypothetical protein
VGSGKSCIGPTSSALSNEFEAGVQSATSSQYLFRSCPTEKASAPPFYGFRQNFHFGRDARTGRPTQAWRCLSRIDGTVPNRTVLVWSRCHHGWSMKRKAKKKLGEAVLACVKKEMAKPRLAMSAREGETDIAVGRTVPVKRENPKLPLHSPPLLRRAR